MIWQDRAVINSAVAHIHDETGIVELRLCETFCRQPGEIARTRRRIAAQIARHNLRLPLAKFSRHEIGLNRDHVRTSRQLRKIRRRDWSNDVEVIERVRLVPNGPRL